MPAYTSNDNVVLLAVRLSGTMFQLIILGSLVEGRRVADEASFHARNVAGNELLTN